MNLLDLPAETHFEILYNLGYQDILTACDADPVLGEVCATPYFWTNKAKRDFGVEREVFQRHLDGYPVSDFYNPEEPKKVYLRYATYNGQVYRGSEKYRDGILDSIEKAAETGDMELVYYFIDLNRSDLNYYYLFIDTATKGFAKGGRKDILLSMLLSSDRKSILLNTIFREAAERNNESLIDYLWSLKMVKDALKGSQKLSAYESIANWAAVGGHLTLFQKYIDKSNEIEVKPLHDRLPTVFVERVARRGRLNTITYLDEQGLFRGPNGNSYIETVRDGATDGGHLNILKYMFDGRYVAPEGDLIEAIYNAASNGHLNVVLYWHDKGYGNFMYDAVEALASTSYTKYDRGTGNALTLIKYLYDTYPDQIRAVATERATERATEDEATEDEEAEDDETEDEEAEDDAAADEEAAETSEDIEEKEEGVDKWPNESLLINMAVEGKNIDVMQFFLDRKNYKPIDLGISVISAVKWDDEKLALYLLDRATLRRDFFDVLVEMAKGRKMDSFLNVLSGKDPGNEDKVEIEVGSGAESGREGDEDDYGSEEEYSTPWWSDQMGIEIRRGDFAEVRRLSELGVVITNSVLWTAIDRGTPEILRYIIEVGLDVGSIGIEEIQEAYDAEDVIPANKEILLEYL